MDLLLLLEENCILRHALQWMGRAGHACKIALVAIRDHDQAMVSLGHFELDSRQV